MFKIGEKVKIDVCGNIEVFGNIIDIKIDGYEYTTEPVYFVKFKSGEVGIYVKEELLKIK